MMAHMKDNLKLCNSVIVVIHILINIIINIIMLVVVIVVVWQPV